ncbi:MAG: fumarate hydratase, partial [Enterobacteriaceae bacterium]
MSATDFFYQPPFPLSEDNSEYYLLTNQYVSTIEVEGKSLLKVEPQALTLLAQQTFHDASF